MALNTDYAIRTGAFDPVQIVKDKKTSMKKAVSPKNLSGL